MTHHDLIIVGAGPAGLAAALSARKAGVEDILLLERDSKAGGILNQCIHNGFGLHTFQEELTGPEYAQRFLDEVLAWNIPIQLNTMVLDITPEKVLTCTSPENGLEEFSAGAIILCMGCRERSRGAMNIAGSRPAGIYSAGTAQRLVNIEGYMPGKTVVIMGSGDIGLIMARRLTLEGATVKCVCNRSAYSSGLRRNIVQCLDDYGIPLLTRHTVTAIHGRDRLEAVTISEVGADKKPIPGSGERVECDTLLLSVGLLPENELSESAGVVLDRVTGGPQVTEQLSTSVPGIFACGNVLHVHDLVDYVSEEAGRAGESAAAYLKNGPAAPGRVVRLKGEGGVRYTVPQTIDVDAMPDKVTVRFRVADQYLGRYLACYVDERRISHIKKPIMTPGEMEQFVLRRKMLGDDPRLVTFRIEEE